MMKSVGEAMAIGRTFKESLQKALRSLEIGRFGLGGDGKIVRVDGQMVDDRTVLDVDFITKKLITPNGDRVFFLRHAFRAGMTVDQLFDITKIDRWFLRHMKEIVDFEEELAKKRDVLEVRDAKTSTLWEAKQLGFSDRQIANLVGSTEDAVRAARKKAGIVPTYRLVDTCAAEFEAYTPYYYSTYGDEDETRQNDKRKVMILGGGPNRIGQGIEFDYCCVHAAFALKELGFETIMVNSNPETVSTDYDTSDKLYFEPLTLEDVLNIYEREKCWGAIAQFGGQTPLNLALGLQSHGVNIIGTSPQSIEIAEDRKYFAAMLDKLKIPQPPNGIATNEAEALDVAAKLGYPVLVRPSFVLGGRAMQIVYSEDDLRHYMRFAVEASPERPVLVDRFLDDAIEVDVDCVADVGLPDGDTVVIGGILEHIEFAGVHSGDAGMVLPPHTLSKEAIQTIREHTHAMARELKVAGLMNVQYAVKDGIVYVLEVNPRASRTVPFVSKAIGVPLAKLAAKVMTGKTLKELGFTREVVPAYFSVKESVFPFNRFFGVDIILGPEMKSTGEVMGMDADLGLAYAKSQMAAGAALPTGGNLFVSVHEAHKSGVAQLASDYAAMGFKLFATEGTARALRARNVPVTQLFKLSEGRPNVLDMVKNGEVALIINTPSGKSPREDEVRIRTAAVQHRVPIMTTLTGAAAAVRGIESLKRHGLSARSLQEYHGE
jgi:carbamoyl-phosphate synthase large subunit